MTTQDFTAMRQAMVESQLRTNDVNDSALLSAILAVPREAFMPEQRRSAAYIDRSVPLANGRALNPPLATARLLAAAGLSAGNHVLLVGAATGYGAAVLSKLGCKVLALEEDVDLYAMAMAALKGIDGVKLVKGSLPAGAAKDGPFDVIVIDGAIEIMPDKLIEQLKIGGRAVYASMDRGVTRLCSGIRTTGGFGARVFADSEAVPLPGFAAVKSFTF